MPPPDHTSIPADGYSRYRKALIVLAVVGGVLLLGVLHLTGVVGPG